LEINRKRINRYMADINDFTNKNTKFTGTTGQRISTGATGTRVDEIGRLRFNTSTNLLEYYTGVLWKSVDAPPTIVTFSVDGGASTTSTFVDRTLSGDAVIVITGSLFSAGATVTFKGSDGADVLASSVTVDSSSQLTTLTPHSSFLGASEPYDIIVTNPSGLTAQLDNCLSVDAKPVFDTASGSLGTITGIQYSSYSLSSAAATDPDGDTITYSISSGSLPPGLSLNTSTGAITGTATQPGSDTTSSFTVTASTPSQSQSRAFTILVKVPVITSFTSTGAFNYTVPSGVSAVQVLVLAGGGSGNNIGGGGGGGGVVLHNSFPVTPGGTVPGTVGSGASAPPSGNHTVPSAGNRGNDSTFGTLTAKGGGSSQSWNAQTGANTVGPTAPGGAGGGGTGEMRGGTGTQPSTSNPGAINYGFPGASGGNNPANNGGNNGTTGSGTHSGGGGGGAGGAGGHPSKVAPGNTEQDQQAGRHGGAGFLSSITGSAIYYGGGGGGSSHASGYNIGNVPGGLGNTPAGTRGQGGGDGTAQRGGGGGGGHYPEHNGSAGGPGIVIVKS
jgi:hypothetical protein